MFRRCVLEDPSRRCSPGGSENGAPRSLVRGLVPRTAALTAHKEPRFELGELGLPATCQWEL